MMSIPKDTKGAAPEDVEAHNVRWPRTDDDHGDSAEDVEAHRVHGFQATEQDDVEAHSARWPRDDDHGDNGQDGDSPRWSGV